MIRLDGTRLVQLIQRLFLTSQAIENASAVVVSIYTFFGIQTGRQSKTAKRLLVFPLETIQSGCYPMNRGVVWRFLEQHFDFSARLLFLATRQVAEDHVQPCFQELGIEGERFGKSGRGQLVILWFAKLIENPRAVAHTEAGMSERERWIELDRIAEVSDCGFKVFGPRRMVSVTGNPVTSPQVFFISYCIASLTLLECILFVRA